MNEIEDSKRTVNKRPLIEEENIKKIAESISKIINNSKSENFKKNCFTLLHKSASKSNLDFQDLSQSEELIENLLSIAVQNHQSTKKKKNKKGTQEDWEKLKKDKFFF